MIRLGPVWVGLFLWAIVAALPANAYIPTQQRPFDNRDYACVQASEWEAYQLQEAYLNDHDIASGFDWLQIYFQSQCPRIIHP